MANTERERSWLRQWGPSLAWAVVLAALLRATVVQAYYIPSGSMEPTLLVGDQILVSRSAYDLHAPLTDTPLLRTGQPARGDVVVFANPAGSGPDLVKRVVGLPGEAVEVRQGRVLINGTAITDPWGRHTGPPARALPPFGPVIVPPDSYFVMGDNRDNSYDSRFWRGPAGGFVPRDDIRGRAFVVLFSLDWQNITPRWARTWADID